MKKELSDLLQRKKCAAYGGDFSKKVKEKCLKKIKKKAEKKPCNLSQ